MNATRLIVVALAVLTLPLAFLATRGPEASTEKPWDKDSDGKISVREVCVPNADWLGQTDGKMRVDGETRKVEEVWLHVEVNECLLEKEGAGPKDRAYVIAHEKAHARGWDHWEGVPWKNPAYFPGYRITGE